MWGIDTEDRTGTPCCVCGDDLPALHHTLCEACLGAFHLRMTEHVETKDCGYVHMNEEDCSTVFLCITCYTATVPSSFMGEG